VPQILLSRRRSRPVVPVVLAVAVLAATALAPTAVAQTPLLSSAASVRTEATSPYAGSDPSTWSTQRLAAQLVVSCVDMGHLDRAVQQSAAGIGAVVLLGHPPAHLAARLAAVGAAATTPVRPFVASDEEGGLVQRLRTLIYPLPSARTMGRWTTARLRTTAHDYAIRMHRLGVLMDLAPDADLDVPGAYIDSLDRSFSADPARVASHDRAWRLGMTSAGVVTVLKHWPGHGSATNSHLGPARIAPLATLQTHDLVPFDRELAAGAPVVMVGHLLSKGLTTGGIPASESPRALHYLRRQAGPDVVVMTDSLSMAAASSSIGRTPAQATVAALEAGADWAMACDSAPLRAVTAVRRALDSGALPRAQADRSARRVLALKARAGLAPSTTG
jgi:beta-N-acetylhexosaminidase